MSGILAFATSRLGAFVAWGLSAFLAISLGGALIMARIEIAGLKDAIHDPKHGWSARLDRANSDLAVCRVNGLTLKEALDVQNAAVLKAQAESAAREGRLALVADQARREAKTAEAGAARILGAKGSTCADADALIMEMLK